MPDEIVTPKVDETPTPDAKPVMSDAPEQQTAPDFEAWLSKQPDDVKKMYESHTGGLRSALDKERRANKKRDDEAARLAREADEAKLGEVDKLKKQLEAIKTERETLAQQVKAQAARDALLIVAEKVKIEFASKIAEQDAIRFALEGATFDEDGAIKDGEKTLTKVITDRPYLVKTPIAQGSTNAAARGGSTTPVMDEAAKRDLAARYGVKAEHIK